MSVELHLHVTSNKVKARQFLKCTSSYSPSGEEKLTVRGYTEWLENGEWKKPHEVTSADIDDRRFIEIMSNEEYWEFFKNTENCWLGEASWKIPEPVKMTWRSLDEVSKIDEDLIQKIDKAYDLENTTPSQVAEKEKVIEFLRTYKEKYGLVIEH